MSRLTLMATSEKATTQKFTILPRLCVHHTSFLWAFCQELVLSTTERFVFLSGAGLPFWSSRRAARDSLDARG